VWRASSICLLASQSTAASLRVSYTADQQNTVFEAQENVPSALHSRRAISETANHFDR
jgi:hypothetical protein